MNMQQGILSTSMVALFMLSGCGSSDDTNSDDSIVSGEIHPQGNDTLIGTVSYDCQSMNSNVSGETFTEKLGADGQLICEQTSYGQYNDFNLVFTSEESTLEISQLVLSQSVSMSDDEKSISGTITTDLKAGVATFNVTSSKDGSVNCTRTYDVNNLPITMYDANEIREYEYLEDKYQVLTDNCPAWIDNEESTNFKITSTQKTTVTDTLGRVSNIYSFFEIK